MASRNFSRAPVLCTTLNFEQARERVTQLKEEPDNMVKLQLYALFKQCTTGPCTTPKPGAFDFVGKAKWQAWTGLGGITKDEATTQYIELIEGLIVADGGSLTGEVAATDSAEKYSTIKVTQDGVIKTITLNRPTKKNAISQIMYNEIIEALKEIGEDPSASIAVLTGAGDYYCSGNDLSNFAQAAADPSLIAGMARDGKDLLFKFVDTLIDFPKPLIGLVNGPAVGVAVTSLGLCDVVYASDKASFVTPMVALGQSPEGCSAYTFPKLMGQSRANEMLLFGRKITAGQAAEWGLVTAVFPDKVFAAETAAHIANIAKLPKESLKLSKQLMRDVDRVHLKAVNVAECELLEGRWQGPECAKAVADFFMSKSKM